MNNTNKIEKYVREFESGITNFDHLEEVLGDYDQVDFPLITLYKLHSVYMERFRFAGETNDEADWCWGNLQLIGALIKEKIIPKKEFTNLFK